MEILKTTLCLMAAMALGASLFAQDPVSGLEDLIGARGAAIDTLSERGHSYLRTEKSDDSAYSYWTEDRSERCVIARVADGRIASIVYAPSSDCAASGDENVSDVGDVSVKDQFDTVCGVMQGNKPIRYRCEVVETQNQEGKRITVLRFPDNEMKLHWHREGQVGVSREGMETMQATYSTHEGETNFVVDGMTFFYISNKDAAKMEVENFKE